jgi:hypothetical protein
MAGERQENGMICVNQTRPHCVNQMGKKQSKALAERHGMGTVWYVWIGLKKLRKRDARESPPLFFREQQQKIPRLATPQMTSVCALVSSELLTMRGPSKNCLA